MYGCSFDLENIGNVERNKNIFTGRFIVIRACVKPGLMNFMYDKDDDDNRSVHSGYLLCVFGLRLESIQPPRVIFNRI